MGSHFIYLRFVLLFGGVWFLYWTIKNSLADVESQEDALDQSRVSSKEVLEKVKQYGNNTSSVVHLYGSLSYFSPNSLVGKDGRCKGVVAYKPGSKNNVMIMDPLCERDDAPQAILDFTKFTQAREKSSLLFPIDIITARQSVEIGYGLLQVGKEPAFNLKEYDPTSIDKKVLSAARQVFKKGVTIEELTLDQIKTKGLMQEVEDVLEEWILTRRSQRMQLLLEVSPFKSHEFKKYFVAHKDNKVEAFLACSPIFARNGFFIHDLIRRPTAMNGVGEALIIEALSHLKEKGYDFASLGTAPLAGLDEAEVNSHYPLLNKLLVHTFNSHKTFMRFKSLYDFKKKFKPTHEEPTYFAFFPPTLNVGDALTIIGLFSSQGPLGDLLFKIKRWLAGEQLPHPLAAILAPNIATLPRPVPFTFPEFISRLRFTFTMFFLNVYTYAATSDMLGEISLNAVKNFGFNYHDFLTHKWFILITSNFLHFGYAHLLGNMIMLFLFCGTLEFIGGTTIAALGFMGSMEANLPMGMIVLPFLKSINFTLWQHMISYMDVGASLGIMGCLGALIQFMRQKRKVLLLMGLITVMISVFQREIFGIDHTFAVLIGYGIGHLYLHQRFQIRGLRRFFVSPGRPSQNNSPIPFRATPR